MWFFQLHFAFNRAARNAAELAKVGEVIKGLVFEEESLKKVPADIQDAFRCILTQGTWVDLLLDEDEKDVVGFGLAVGRPESTLINELAY